MARITFFFFFFSLLASALMTVLASPIPTPEPEPENIELERRITRVGRGTWFHVGVGNCGKRSKDSEPVVAMGKAFYDRNRGSNCGQWIQIVDTVTRKKAYGQLWDSCQSCQDQDIDLSPSLFQKFAPLSKGTLKLSWYFMPKGFKP